MSAEPRNLPAVVEAAVTVKTPALQSSVVVPVMIADAGDRAVRRFLEFFAASINNDNTRMAYYRAVCSFFAWLDQHRIGGLADIEPLHVAAYVKALEATASKPTVNSTWRLSACCSTGSLSARSSPSTRRMRCAAPSMSSNAARRRC